MDRSGADLGAQKVLKWGPWRVQKKLSRVKLNEVEEVEWSEAAEKGGWSEGEGTRG